MGSELVNDSSSPHSYEEVFLKTFAYYLAIGMSYDEFYNQDPSLVIAYRQAHQYKIQEKNEQEYIQGIYNMDAFSVVLGNLFKKKGDPRLSYLKEPLPITKDQLKEKEQKDFKYGEEQLLIQMKRLVKEGEKNGGK